MSEQIRRKPDQPEANATAEAVEKPEEQAHAHTSFGDASLSVTPKDVDEQDASAHDLTARQLQSDNADEKQQEMLDEAIDLSFPASDPPAVTGGVTRIEVPKSPARP